MEIRKKLYHTAKLLNCEKLCVCCYRHLIEDVIKCKSVPADGMTVDEFANSHNQGTYLIRMSGHLSCIIGGIVYDIWDCRDEFVTDAWRVD